MKELKKNGNTKELDLTLQVMLSRLIRTIDGKVYDIIQKEDFARKLPMMDTNFIMKHIQLIDERVGLNTTLHCTCDFCGFDFDSPFRETGEFFGPTIDI